MNRLQVKRRKSSRSRRFTSAPSPVMAYFVPWLTIMFASAASNWPIIASTPIIPPLGFLVLLAWRQLHPGLLPVWAGLPLGFVDDLMSGQPLGSGILTWSFSMLALELIEFRFPWRNFLIEWVVATGMIVSYILVIWLIADAAGGNTVLLLLLPQIALSVLLYPIVGRLVAQLDKLRLVRFWAFG